MDLTIENIPKTTKLVILVGPSGSGKSSLFDAINAWGKDQRRSQYDSEYYERYEHSINSGSQEYFSDLGVTIEADDLPSIWVKPVIFVRPIDTLQNLARHP